MSVSLTLRNERLIRARPEKVWLVFSRITDWPSWNPQVDQVSRVLPGLTGSRFSLSLSPLGLPMRVQAELEQVLEGRLVSYRGQWLGIETRRSFSFLEVGGGTQVVSLEELWGWPLILMRPFISLEGLNRAAQDWLESLAARAEG